MLCVKQKIIRFVCVFISGHLGILFTSGSKKHSYKKRTSRFWHVAIDYRCMQQEVLFVGLVVTVVTVLYAFVKGNKQKKK